MDEFDAFGRKKNEDTMSDLGWGATGEAPPPVERPASADAPTSTVPPSPAADWSPAQPVSGTPKLPRRRSGRNPIAMLVQFAVIAGIGFGVWALVDSGADAVKRTTDAFKTFTVPDLNVPTPQPVNPVDPEGNTPPKQVKARKLLTAQGLKDALKAMERDTPGLIQNFRLDATQIQYQVQRGDKWAIASFAAAAEAPEIVTQQERPPTKDGIRYGEFDVGAPARMIRGAGARLNKARADVDYLIADKALGPVRWVVYFKGGRYAIGNAQGRITQVY
jgi:hypothetical protein